MVSIWRVQRQEILAWPGHTRPHALRSEQWKTCFLTSEVKVESKRKMKQLGFCQPGVGGWAIGCEVSFLITNMQIVITIDFHLPFCESICFFWRHQYPLYKFYSRVIPPVTILLAYRVSSNFSHCRKVVASGLPGCQGNTVGMRHEIASMMRFSCCIARSHVWSTAYGGLCVVVAKISSKRVYDMLFCSCFDV